MATITGGTLRTPRGTLAWRPVAPVAKAYQFFTRNSHDGYRCLGVVGNWDHLRANRPGDHTPYSTHDTWIGKKHYVPKRGWVYAIDGLVAEPAKFERWFLARLRAGHYTETKYWNILHRHWNRRVVRAGVPFARASYSGDHHLHLSFMPGAEFSPIDILGDYEHWRTTGSNRTTAKPAARPAAAPTRPVDVAAARLPIVRKGATGTVVKMAQAFLLARNMWPRNDRSARANIDGKFGDDTAAKVRVIQQQTGLPPTGVVDAATWRMLAPDRPSTVIRGSDGFYVWLLQGLLMARGFNPGRIDGNAGDGTIGALKRFQAARKVRNSVVKGRGDGIGGTNTWVALVTL